MLRICGVSSKAKDFTRLRTREAEVDMKNGPELIWTDQLPFEVQDSIIEGIHDIEDGKAFTHDQVIQEAKQKYGF